MPQRCDHSCCVLFNILTKYDSISTICQVTADGTYTVLTKYDSISTICQVTADGTYTGSEKTAHFFYFCSNFAECQPIYVIFGTVTLTPE